MLLELNDLEIATIKESLTSTIETMNESIEVYEYDLAKGIIPTEIDEQDYNAWLNIKYKALAIIKKIYKTKSDDNQ